MGIKTRIREKLRNFLGISALDKQLKSLTSHDLIQQLEARARASSAEFIEAHMIKAKALDGWKNVVNFALDEMPLNGDGLFCEFGVYQGITINHIARRIKSKVYGFDSFKGLPEYWRDGFPAGTFDFKNTDLPVCESNVELVVGWFDETLPHFLDLHPEPVMFVHVDCDLYSSTKTILDNLGNRLIAGSVLVFDEYFNYPGWKEHEHRAFSEFIEATGCRFNYLCYNRFHEQVAVKIL